MRIVQTVFGVFHHFDLARELQQRGHLECIFSTWPRARLNREGLPRDKVKTFPWIHTPEFLLAKYGLLSDWMSDQTGYANALTFDEYTLRTLPECDALIGISGSSLKTGRLLQSRGGVFVCDRGSSHQRYQERTVSDEYRRWNVDRAAADVRDIVREEHIYEVADAITVPSRFAARSFVESGVDPKKLHVIPYGVRLERFTPVSTPPDDVFTVLFAGSVSLRKGVPYLFEAFAKLSGKKRLRIAGSLHGDMKTVLEKLPREHVEFLGSVPQEKLAELMSSSHVMVLPSIEEGLALVQGQALACGCPVICTTNTGGEDLFNDGVEGFVVAVRDVEALRNRMQQLADDPPLQVQMRAAALERVKHLGGWSQYGDSWVTLLHNLTGR